MTGIPLVTNCGLCWGWVSFQYFWGAEFLPVPRSISSVSNLFLGNALYEFWEFGRYNLGEVSNRASWSRHEYLKVFWLKITQRGLSFRRENSVWSFTQMLPRDACFYDSLNSWNGNSRAFTYQATSPSSFTQGQGSVRSGGEENNRLSNSPSPGPTPTRSLLINWFRPDE